MMPNLTPTKTRQTGKWTHFMSSLHQREQNFYDKVNVGTINIVKTSQEGQWKGLYRACVYLCEEK